MPIFTVGVGSDQQPTNVRVSDLVAPARAYPGDSYTVTGFVQSQRPADVAPGDVKGAGVIVDVELLSRQSEGESAGAEPSPWQVEARQQVTLGTQGEVLPVKFELTPQEIGRRTLRFCVEAPEGDHHSADDYREVDIEIVDRKTRVLILAGGPTREYRFLRNQLYRDRSSSVDVLLQSARGGISQEADKLLDDFPTSREEMFDYDCLLAFDPDWRALTPAQVDLLEQWVAEQGGGLIVIAGPVFTGTMIGGWVEDPAMAKIRALYPVEFHRRFSVLEERAYVAEEPWPLEFTHEGLEAEYLWLDNAATAGRVPTGRGIADVSATPWAGFQGVYSFAPVKGPKPAATVLAWFSDPRAAQAGEQPVYFAAQFYGSGRVFYIGSGEMWRLRRLDETYFEQLYTKLVRHVSQGRLSRGSSRGVLLLGQDRYLLGNTVEVRAQLTNARLEPLVAEDVALQVVGPQGAVQTVTLRPEASRAGTFAGRFSVLGEGSYRLELLVPESADERLTRRIQVMVPQLERENPQRNDRLLRRIADGTVGKSYVGFGAALGTGGDSLVGQLKDCTRIEIRADEPDPDWERTWRMWMMCALCCLLCGEWLIRRLAKLA
ncbi:MAG: hypothetical protein A2V70_17090 [Planctomycetes bacterium RBG_13_63_9]|nr:MAG: hypothetical protein A2V70_17090 [Planctomycetes bacterium RBG_13_63_9]